jgi:hypothetical protein
MMVFRVPANKKTMKQELKNHLLIMLSLSDIRATSVVPTLPLPTKAHNELNKHCQTKEG